MIKYFKKKLNLKEINRELNKKKLKQDKNQDHVNKLYQLSFKLREEHKKLAQQKTDIEL